MRSGLLFPSDHFPDSYYLEAPAQLAIDSESHLIEQAQNGELIAFNQLVFQYQEGVYNVALRLIGAGELAADITQETFLSAYQNLRRFRGGSFRAWLFRIATNLSYDLIRKGEKRRNESLEALQDAAGDGGALVDLGETPEDGALRRELVAEIKRGLLTLPVEQRATLILCDIQGMSYEEIAVTTSASLGTVKSRLSRGRAHLREFLMARRELLPGQFRQKV